MARLARLKPRGGPQTYHVYNRLAGFPGVFPLQAPGAREEFLRLLLFYAGIYGCLLAAFSIMGNHYHLVIQFAAFRVLTRAELWVIASRLYQGRLFKPYLFWTSRHWERFNRRLFDVSEFMRNLESDYARLHNRRFGRKGQLWADRFKSNLLTSRDALQAVALYVELNAVRARLVNRPEAYRFSSARFRLAGARRPAWLMSLLDLWGMTDPVKASRRHFAALAHRGGLRIDKQDELLRALIRQEGSDGYSYGSYRENLRYMNDSLALGDQTQLDDIGRLLSAAGVYRRLKRAVRAPDGPLCMLRVPRACLTPAG